MADADDGRRHCVESGRLGRMMLMMLAVVAWEWERLRRLIVANGEGLGG